MSNKEYKQSLDSYHYQEVDDDISIMWTFMTFLSATCFVIALFKSASISIYYLIFGMILFLTSIPLEILIKHHFHVGKYGKNSL